MSNQYSESGGSHRGISNSSINEQRSGKPISVPQTPS